MNSAINAFRIAVGDNISIQSMVDMFVDEYEDETGIDTGNSINILYDSTNDYYSMGEGDSTTIDNMEYATDGEAQSAYVASDAVNFQSYSEDTIKEQGSYSLKMIATQTDSLNDIITKTFSTPINLSNRDNIKFKARSTRTGTNFKLHFIKEFEPDNDTVLLLNFNGTDGDNSTTDESDSEHTVTFFNTAHIEDTHKKFGSTSLELDGNSDYLTIPTHSDFAIGTGDFTIESWFRLKALTDYYWLLGSDSNYDFDIAFLDPFGTKIRVYLEGSSWDFSVTLAQDVWTHIAVSRNGTNLRLFLNGIQQGSTQTSSDNIAQTPLVIGARGAKDDHYFNGYIDSFRISNIARYTSNFIPSAYFASNVAISSANTWETKEIDISSYSNAEKEDIEGLAIEITNADSANTIYIDEMYAYANATGFTLISENQTAEAVPDEARIVILMEEVSSITLNTDLKAWVSRDDGVTYAQITLTDVGDYGTNIKILYGSVDLTASGIGSGTDMVYKLITYNSKNCKIHGTSVAWR